MENKSLLKDRRVIEEIKRHLWIESEKAGHDIGFDQASADWLEHFSKAWMQYHMPNKTPSTHQNNYSKNIPSKTQPIKSKSNKFI